METHPRGDTKVRTDNAVRVIKNAAARKGLEQDRWFWLNMIQDERKVAGSLGQARNTIMAEINSWPDSGEEGKRRLTR